MASRHSDAEQVDAIKDWWKENGQSVIAGIVIGVGGLFGWKGWNAWQHNQAEQASTHYSALQQAMVTDDADSAAKAAEVLRGSYDSTMYAVLAALSQARLSAEQGDPTSSMQHLQWVIDNSSLPTITSLAKIRLARLLVTTGDFDRALALLNEEIPASYASLASEIRGDALAAKGDTEEARNAYEQALIGAQGSGDTNFLRMKRDEIVIRDTDDTAPSADSS